MPAKSRVFSVEEAVEYQIPINLALGAMVEI